MWCSKSAESKFARARCGYYLHMKCSRLAALALILVAGPARAGTELLVTAGGGFGKEGASHGCLETGNGTCPATRPSGVMLLGAGFARVADDGVRGSLHLEGAVSFGGDQNRSVQLLGTAGWQGHRLVAEGGLGTALLWSSDHDPALGGLLHLGVGLRIVPSLSVVARADTVISDDRRPYFLGLALEFSPLLALRAGP
jgi:hypothetical protein